MTSFEKEEVSKGQLTNLGVSVEKEDQFYIDLNES
jgi:hypothetical protein